VRDTVLLIAAGALVAAWWEHLRGTQHRRRQSDPLRPHWPEAAGDVPGPSVWVQSWWWRSAEPPNAGVCLRWGTMFLYIYFHSAALRIYIYQARSPSLLWHCWLGVRKSIRPIKNWVMRCCLGYLSIVSCKWFAYGPADTTATPSSLASLKSRLV